MSTSSKDNKTGILLMIAAMFGFALADTLIKWSSETGSGGAGPGQIILYLGVSGLIMFGAMLVRSGERLSRATLFDRMVLLRTFGDLIGVIGFITALTRMPVGDASAILQVQPMVVMVGAAVFLNERISLSRWIAVIAAFCGVMIIVRPGMETFHPASAFVLLGVIGLSIRDLVTRALDPAHSTVAVSFIAATMLMPLGLILHGVKDIPVDFALETNIVLIASGICGTLAYYAITLATRIGEVSVVAPFRYSRILAAFLVAFVILGERPDHWTIIGAMVVVAAGVWVMLRERGG